MGGILALLAGLATALGIAWLYENNQAFRRASTEGAERLRRSTERTVKQARSGSSAVAGIVAVNLNRCSREDLVGAGLSEDLAERVIENRPYRNKLDLVSRLVIPEGEYESIKHVIEVDDGSAGEPIKVAS